MALDQTNRPLWLRCTAGVIAAVLAAAFRWQFLGILENNFTFLNFFPAVAAAALYGGFASGLAATVASAALANYFWMEPADFGISNIADLVGITIFLLIGIFISYLAEATFRAQARAHKLEEESRLAAEREKAIFELQKSESKYRELVQNANSVIIRWKRDGTLTFFNEYAQKFFGYSAGEVIGKSVNILVPERESTGGDLTTLIQDIVNHPERYVNNINENILQDGSRVWMAWTNKPVFDDNGQVLEILAVASDITERKRAEENVARLAAIVESSDDAIIGKTLFGEITTWNRAAEEIYGYTAEEVIGQPISLLVPNDSPDEVPAILQGISHGEVVNQYDALRRRKDGRNIHVSLTVSAIRDASGKIIGASTIARDITERKQMEDELRKSRDQLDLRVLERTADLKKVNDKLLIEIQERRRADEAVRASEREFRLLADAMPQIVWIARPDGWNIYFNQRWLDYTGQTLEESYGDGWNKPFHPDDQQRAWDAWQNATKNGAVYDLECRLRRADGVYRWWLIRGVPVLDERGTVLKWFGTFTDIDERKRNAEKVEAERQRFYEVLETLPVYVCLLTPDYHVPFANRVFRERFGESAGLRCFEHLFGRSEPCEVCETYKALKTMAPHQWEWTGPDSRNYSVFDFPFTDTDGSRLILEMGIDITERKQAEAELTATVARLELVNAELQEFAFVASHDLQEPLRKIQTFCGMAQKRCAPVLDSAGKDYLDRVVNSASRMRQLLRDLLDFSRVATRPEPFKKIDLVKIVLEAADVFEASVKDTGCQIEVENIPAIEADESQMSRLFQNLIGNALTFRSGETPKVKVHGKLVGQRLCEIVVEDNGIGFDSQFAELIFKPFQRLHGCGEYDGTGMGLAICRKIVERHGGSIRAESEQGKGSTFIIRLPVKRAYSG